MELQKFQQDILKQLYEYEMQGGQARPVRDESFTSLPATLLYCLTLITTIGDSLSWPTSFA